MRSRHILYSTKPDIDSKVAYFRKIFNSTKLLDLTLLGAILAPCLEVCMVIYVADLRKIIQLDLRDLNYMLLMTTDTAGR
jgi:hypothetical protein